MIFRRQRISELSACTRVRQNFLDKLSRFWEFQGIALKIPRVENELLCLFTFHEKVQKLGGFVKCSEDRKWGELALSLGFASKSGSASALRGHYERILYPFDVVCHFFICSLLNLIGLFHESQIINLIILSAI
jgi:histone demethylase JARID1